MRSTIAFAIGALVLGLFGFAFLRVARLDGHMADAAERLSTLQYSAAQESLSGAEQYANHARFVPAYHFVAFFLVLINVVFTVVQVFRHPSLATVVAALAAVALGLVYWYARAFVVTVQDRVIRLEMQLRLQRVLPDDLRSRIGEITRGQFVALRFASDAELPALVRKVLDEKITDQKQIKLAVRDWQADYLRV